MGNSFITRYWIARPMHTFHVILSVVAVASHVFSGISGEAWLAAFGNIIAIIAIFHFFVHTNLHRKYLFSTDYHRTYSLPQKKITRINTIFLVILVIAVCVGMVLAREVYTGTLIAKLQMLFMYLLNKGFGVIFESDGLGTEEVLVQQDQTLLEALNGVAAKSDQPWEEAANYIQTIVIIGGLVLMLIIGIFALTGVIRRAISNVRQTDEEKVWRETVDREERLERRTPRRVKRLGNSPADRIRRAYQRCINRNRHRGQTVPAWMTPSEIESMVSLPKEDKYHLLHSIYQKARYSESGCTDQEARQAKELKI